MVWDPSIECMPSEKRRELQDIRLRQTVHRAYNIPFYRSKFKEMGLNPDDIKGVEDLKYLPFTTKEDLRDNYPFGMFAVPMDRVVRIHCSSGTTGKPTVVGYTENDIKVWSDVMARTLGCAGTTSLDIVHIAYGYGLFTGGLGVHYGAERIGATAIPVSGGNTKRQLMLMQDFGATILACTPSYALRLAEVGAELGIDMTKMKLRCGLLGAEPWSNNMRLQIEEKLKIDALDIYGLSEVIGPGVASECLEKKGLHVFDDHFYPEIIDTKTGEPAASGHFGELVFTSLTKEALPIIRYRTRDITRFIEEKCECGRTHVKIDRLQGRTDDMLVIRGINVFPSQIEAALLNINEAEPHYQLVIDRKDSLDQLEVRVEVSEAIFSDEVRQLERLEKKIRDEIMSSLGIGVNVRLVEPKTIPRSEGKAQRIIDKRIL